MWARWIELGLGIWLLLCPWILPSHAGGERFAILGLLTIVASIVSVFRPGGWIHWIVPAAGVALITISVLTAPHPLPPLLQNNVIVGLTLLMLGVVPDRAFEPPRRWRELEARIRSREAAPLPRVSNTLESPDFSRKTTPGGDRSLP
jgi:hypothetical protein